MSGRTSTPNLSELQSTLLDGGTVTEDEWGRAHHAADLARARALAEEARTSQAAEEKRLAEVDLLRDEIKAAGLGDYSTVAPAFRAYVEAGRAFQVAIDDHNGRIRDFAARARELSAHSDVELAPRIEASLVKSRADSLIKYAGKPIIDPQLPVS